MGVDEEEEEVRKTREGGVGRCGEGVLQKEDVTVTSRQTDRR